jgi:hypothetical protein
MQDTTDVPRAAPDDSAPPLADDRGLGSCGAGNTAADTADNSREGTEPQLRRTSSAGHSGLGEAGASIVAGTADAPQHARGGTRRQHEPRRRIMPEDFMMYSYKVPDAHFCYRWGRLVV